MITKRGLRRFLNITYKTLNKLYTTKPFNILDRALNEIWMVENDTFLENKTLDFLAFFLILIHTT